MLRCIILTPLYAGEELPWIAPQAGGFPDLRGWRLGVRAAVRADAAARRGGF